MADDRELLDELAESLRPGAVEPPPARVQALRRLVTRRAPLRVITPGHATQEASTAPHVFRTAASAPPPPARAPWTDHRLMTMFSAVAAVLVLVVGAAVVLGGGSGAPSSSQRLLLVQNAAYRVQLALDRQDPPAVAKADAEMLRAADQVEGADRDQVQKVAVPVHVQAVAFLRDHASPEILSDVPGAVPASGTPSAVEPGTPDLSSLPLPTTIPDLGAPTTVTIKVPVATSVVVSPGIQPPPPAPKLTVTGIQPRLDGAFEVNFTVSGFTPDPSGGPGTYTLRFSFDNGVDATTYTGVSPWTFPLLKAILHRQVCAEIVDSAGEPVPGSRTCTNIINI